MRPQAEKDARVLLLLLLAIAMAVAWGMIFLGPWQAVGELPVLVLWALAVFLAAGPAGGGRR